MKVKTLPLLSSQTSLALKFIKASGSTRFQNRYFRNLMLQGEMIMIANTKASHHRSQISNYENEFTSKIKFQRSLLRVIDMS